MKAAYITLGCKVNQYESNAMRQALEQAGYETVGENEQADVYVVNSCTVTAESSRKSRQALRAARRRNPNAVTVLTGCYPQAYADELQTLTEADIVLGNKTNALLPEAIRRFRETGKRLIEVEPHGRTDGYKGVGAAAFEGHTRAFIKIQDGCNRYCTYCIIPKSRGFSRSRDPEEIYRELKEIAANGYKEVVFVGINLSAYGLDTSGNIADALELAEKTDGIERIRLGSLEPDHLTDEVLTRMRGFSKFCPQFHLSLQSGCDRTLRRMNRHYDTAFFTDLCDRLRAMFPGLSLTTDIICGFPGETEEEFRETVAYAKKTGFMKVHVFPYSPREGTPAAKMDGQIPKEEKARRCAILQKECDGVRAAFLQTLVGTTQRVLFETPKNGFACGYTENYTPVRVRTDLPLAGEIRTVRVVEATGNDVRAVLTD